MEKIQEKKEKKNNSQKKWLLKNEDYYNNYWNDKLKNKKIYCIYCNCETSITHKARHNKSIKHIHNQNIYVFDNILSSIDIFD